MLKMYACAQREKVQCLFFMGVNTSNRREEPGNKGPPCIIHNQQGKNLKMNITKTLKVLYHNVLAAAGPEQFSSQQDINHLSGFPCRVPSL